MKKICKKVILIVIVLISIPNMVLANSNYSLDKEDVEGIYYYRTGGNTNDGTGIFQKYKLNNNTVYCIEAGVPINSLEYIYSGDINNLPYDIEINKLIELIGHYGYDYSNHKTEKFQMATQALIWEIVSNSSVEYYTLPSGEGDYIDTSQERAIINELVSRHYDKPSFDNEIININLGESIVLNDLNEVLDNFEVSSSKNINVEINNNNLIITPLTKGNYNITLTKKKYDGLTTIMYENIDSASQKMALFRVTNDVISKVNVTVSAGNLILKKLDSETNLNIPQGDGKLENAIYGVYNNEDILITEIKTNEKGEASTGEILELGKYYIREISASIGYKLDETKYYFEITSDNLEITLNVYEDVIKSFIEINKYYANSVTGTLIPETNIEFGIYDSDNELVIKIVTDNNGYASMNLVYGSYRVKQLTTTSGYEKIDDFFITINEESAEVIKYSFTNAEVTAKIKLIKKDLETNQNIISNSASFKIFNIDTNEYVCQFINYPTQIKLCVFETDENGEFITPLSLPSGNYYIEEVIAPNGYFMSDEKIYFTIDEEANLYNYGENKYLEIIFYNTLIKGEITIYKEGEKEIFVDGEIKYEKYSLDGVEFALYAKENIIAADGSIIYYKDALIARGVTNLYGFLYFKNLYLGSYYIKELSTVTGLKLDINEYEIDLNSENDYSELVSKNISLVNEREKGKIQITKKDATTNELIQNTKIEIYTINNILVFSGLTDEHGKIEINLPTGSYYIREVIASDGYIVTDEIIFFDVIDSGEILEIEILNEKIIVDVPNTSMYKNNKISVLGSLIFFLGIGIKNDEKTIIKKRK